MLKAQSDFLTYHNQNPHIYQEYLRFAEELHAAGICRKSISMITERIRWNTATRGSGEFKIPNSFRAGYSRLLVWKNIKFQYPGCFMMKHSDIDGVFSPDFHDLLTWNRIYWNSFSVGNKQ
jgi:hypothetical protein